MKLLFKGLLWLLGGFLTLIIIIITLYSIRLAMTDWGEAARNDINAWHQLITEHHPGPVDLRNPTFVETMQKARSEALALADKTETRAGYRWVMERYKSIYDDPHLTGYAVGLPDVGWELWFGTYEWPGFHAALKIDRAGKPYMLVTNDGGGFLLGDKILSCDQKEIGIWLRETVFKFRGSGIAARARNAAPWLFTRHGNPFITEPTACIVEGDEKSRTLTWSSISSSDWRTAAPGRSRSGGTFDYIVNDNTAWIKLPSFNNRLSEDLQTLSDEIKADINSLRAASVVIFDIRGNTGGNSIWGDRISQIVWSPDYVKAFTRTTAEGVDWRLSEDNIAHVRSAAERIPGWATLADDMALSLDNGKSLHRQQFTQRQPTRDVVSPLNGQVVVLIDSVCASSCLDFLDLVTSFEDIILVGEETSADTNYIDVRGVFLPGYRFRAVVPLKVYRGRVRPDGGSYIPDIYFPMGIDQTNDLTMIDWINKVIFK